MKTDHYSWYKLGKTDLIDSLNLPTILLQFNYISGEWKSNEAIKWLYIPFQTFKCRHIFFSLFYIFFSWGKRLGKFKNGWENLLLITVRGCHTSTPSKKTIDIFVAWEFFACQRVTKIKQFFHQPSNKVTRATESWKISLKCWTFANVILMFWLCRFMLYSGQYSTNGWWNL